MQRGIPLGLLGLPMALSAPVFVVAEDIPLDSPTIEIDQDLEKIVELPSSELEVSDSTETVLEVQTVAPETEDTFESTTVPETPELPPEEPIIQEGFQIFNLFAESQGEESPTVVYDFPFQVWGNLNEAFVQPCRPYAPTGITKFDFQGRWDSDVECVFTHWNDPVNTYAFNNLEVYLGFTLVPNIEEPAAWAGTVRVRIYEADATWNSLALIAESDPLNATSLPQVQNSNVCTGEGTAASPFSTGCLTLFSFVDSVTLTAGTRYIFQLYGADIETQTEYSSFLRGYPYPGLLMVGASVFTSPFGMDGIQESPQAGTGSVYMRLLSTAEEQEGFSNVLFLPGFLGSRLYTTSGRSLWEPNGSNDVRDLALNEDGTSMLPIYVGQTVDYIALNGIQTPKPIYGELLEWLEELKSTDHLIQDWASYSYDWRYDVFDVIDQGTIREDGSKDYVISLVEALADNSYNGRVTIVAHSNGGLLAKALMIRLEEQDKASLVDKVVLVGTPQVGTPQGMLGLLHGNNILPPYITLQGEARASAMTMPGAYALLPSEPYFDTLFAPIVSFEDGALTTTYKNILGEIITDSLTAVAFMLNNPETRHIANIFEANTPSSLSVSLMNRAAETHALLDVWEPQEGTNVYEIAGWGNRTAVGAHYTTELTLCRSNALSCTPQEAVEYTPGTVLDGDDTVLSSSALYMDKGVYFDLYQLNTLENGENEHRKHENIVGSSKLHEYLSYIFGIGETYNEKLFSSEAPSGSRNYVSVSVHSPVLISLTDSAGRQTGIFPDPESDLFYVVEDIPGSSVEFGGEGKYVAVPTEGTYEVSIKGIGEGTFSVQIEEFLENTQTSVVTKLPVTEDTYASMTIAGDTGELSPLLVDEDGDGNIDMTIAFVKNEIVAYEEPTEEPIEVASEGGENSSKKKNTTVLQESSTETNEAVVTTDDFLNPDFFQPPIKVEEKRVLQTLPLFLDKPAQGTPTQTASVYDAINRVLAWILVLLNKVLSGILGFLG